MNYFEAFLSCSEIVLLLIQDRVKHSQVVEHYNIRYLNWNFRVMYALVVLVSVVRASS